MKTYCARKFVGVPTHVCTGGRLCKGTCTPKQHPFVVGDKVYCTVYGARGWHTVLAVRPRDGYIQIDGVRPWCPPYNFTKDEAEVARRQEIWRS